METVLIPSYFIIRLTNI